MDSLTVPLRDRPGTIEDSTKSDTVYVRGLSREGSDSEILGLLSEIKSPTEVDLTMRTHSGQVWAQYDSVTTAAEVILSLHQQVFQGVSLSLRYELGRDKHGKRIVDRSQHSTVIRKVDYRRGVEGTGAQDNSSSMKKIKNNLVCGTCNCSILVERGNSVHGLNISAAETNIRTSFKNNIPVGVSYSSKSLFVGKAEYPFPSGLYLSRVIQLTRTVPPDNKLLRIITDCAYFGNKYSKEISEAMAMVDATRRAIHLALHTTPEQVIPIVDSSTSVHSTGATTTGNSAVAGAGSTAGTSFGTAKSSTSSCDSATRSSTFTSRYEEVVVYVLGDGKLPLSAACLCLSMPDNWIFHSIDPLMITSEQGEETSKPVAASNTNFSMSNHSTGGGGDAICSSSSNEYNTGNEYEGRFFRHACYSQNFQIPPNTGGKSRLSIVVCCHSHAPLQEFWDRISINSTVPKTAAGSTLHNSSSSRESADIPHPDVSTGTDPRTAAGNGSSKIAITMACCANYADLYCTPGMRAEEEVATATSSSTSAANDPIGDTNSAYSLSPPAPPPPPPPPAALSSSSSSSSSPSSSNIDSSTATRLLLEFDDFEVYSPKRTIKIYHSTSTSRL